MVESAFAKLNGISPSGYFKVDFLTDIDKSFARISRLSSMTLFLFFAVRFCAIEVKFWNLHLFIALSTRISLWCNFWTNSFRFSFPLSGDDSRNSVTSSLSDTPQLKFIRLSLSIPTSNGLIYCSINICIMFWTSFAVAKFVTYEKACKYQGHTFPVVLLCFCLFGMAETPFKNGIFWSTEGFYTTWCVGDSVDGLLASLVYRYSLWLLLLSLHWQPSVCKHFF